MRWLREHFEEVAGGVLLSVMCVIGAIQVVSRYALTSPLAWTEELATMLFAWLVFIGASLALKKNEHFAIDVIVKLLPTTAEKYVSLVRHSAILVFCLLILVFGVQLVLDNWYVLTPMMGVSRSWIYLSLPFGALLMLARSIELLALDWRGNSALSENAAEEGIR